MAENNQVIVRFPPSPTGLLHMGNVRTALYNYLFARQNNGNFLIRVEDTDKARSKKEYEENMFESMHWLGLEHDNKGKEWRQTERTEIYKKYLDELLKSGAAYISQETEGENREVVRFKNPGGKIKFEDLIRGEVEIEVGDLGDFIIARNINEPLYHLAVVIDDLESGITHIIRGEDHISNTPRQILIWRAITEVSKVPFDTPKYAHLPMILAEDKSKLSKRKHGEAVSLKY
jgi:glutamyl/glutaminyl-tRNA synthetase